MPHDEGPTATGDADSTRGSNTKPPGADSLRAADAELKLAQVLRGFLQPHARAAAVLLNELDAGSVSNPTQLRRVIQSGSA